MEAIQVWNNDDDDDERTWPIQIFSYEYGTDVAYKIWLLARWGDDFLLLNPLMAIRTE